MSTNKKASRPLSTSDMKDFDRFVASTSQPRRPKVSRGGNSNFDPLATPIIRQAAVLGAGSPTHDSKKTLKHLPVPHPAPGQPMSPVSRRSVFFEGPQRRISHSSGKDRLLVFSAASHPDDRGPGASTLPGAAAQVRTSEPHSGYLLVHNTSRPQFSHIPLPRANDIKAEHKPLTTRFAEILTKKGDQQVTCNGGLPPAPPLPLTTGDEPEPNSEIARGLGVSPRKNRSGGRDRIGRNKQGFILSYLSSRNVTWLR